MTLNFDVNFVKSLCAIFLLAVLISPATANDSKIEYTPETSEVIITSKFISTWTIMEIRDHVVIHVMTTDDFVKAYNTVDELRQIIDLPILVNHGMENDKISYEIVVGRFEDSSEAEKYLNLLL